jgi:hypothetical protein
MKTPTWGYIVGVCMMFFGGCGVVSNLQQISTPKVLDMQRKVFDGMANNEKDADSLVPRSLDSLGITIDQKKLSKAFGKMSKSIESAFHMSDFTRTWMVRFGYIGLFTAVIYILGGVFLLIKRRFSLKLAYGAIVLSILFNITRWLVLTLGSTKDDFVGYTTGSLHLFGLVIDIILIVVIIASDKTAYSLSENTSPLTPV